MTPDTPGPERFTPRELVLAAAARTVPAVFREPLDQKGLASPATATLGLPETALELCAGDPQDSGPTIRK